MSVGGISFLQRAFGIFRWLACGVLASPLLAVALTLPIGKGRTDFIWNGKTVPVWTYRPASAQVDAPIIFVCHGANRDGDNYRDSWVTQAEAHACLIVAPEFTDSAFPGTSGYNLGNMVTSGGAARPQSEWAFGVIEAVFDAVRAALGAGARTSYFIYGHSAGAQFVHRMLLYAPQMRAARAISANAGWYTVPELPTAFPYGLGGSDYSLELVRARLAQPFVVLLGTADTDPNDPELNHTAGADAQGATRLARGEYFYAHASAAASGFGATFGWQLGHAPGVAHSTSAMTPYAAAWLFSESPNVPPLDPASDPDSSDITLTHLGYEATFNHAYTTSSTAVALPWSDNTTIPGWYLYQNAAGTPSTVTTQASLSGTSAGPVFLISHVDAPGNFVLGTRVTDANAGAAGSSANAYYLALRLTNHTGGVISQFALSYTGAQFYRSLGTTSSTIDVSYQVVAGASTPSFTSGAWTSLPTLTFTSPQNGTGQSSASTVNFNQDGNFVDFAPALVSGLTWADGQALWFRWRVPNVASTDQGVGIDNVSFAATAPWAAPVIGTGPASSTVTAGTAVALSVAASGTQPLSYQWSRGGVALEGATDATLSFAAIGANDAGAYTVAITNAAGSVTSAPAVITVLSPPAIVTAPQPMALLSGQELTLSVSATGGSLSYQWARNGEPVAGATGATFTVTHVTPADAGSYAVTVTNAAGSTTTASVAVTVGTSAIANLSIRATAGAADQTLIAGFVVAEGARQVLVQSPTLGRLGVSGALADPRLAIYQGGSILVENDNWGAAANASEVAEAIALLGASELPAGGADAAILTDLPTGVYTAQVSTAVGTAGVGIAAVFAAAGEGQLANVSGRCFVGSGDAIVIGGFVISGDAPKPMLLRAIGPTLSDYGVQGVLLDPELKVFAGSAVIATNDDWSANPDDAAMLVTASSRLGAFALEQGSKDAALLVTLPPGVYTVQMSGVGGKTGVALIEIYDAQ